MYFIVCDDNKDFADYFGKQLSETEPDSIVKVFHSAKRLLFNLPELSGYVDAIFLDINLENINGIDVAVDIQHRYPNISIVYITGYPDDAGDIQLSAGCCACCISCKACENRISEKCHRAY